MEIMSVLLAAEAVFTNGSKVLGFMFFLIIVLAILTSCIKIVPQATSFVVERLGGFQATWGVGIHFKMPFIDRVAKRVVLKEQVGLFNLSDPPTTTHPSSMLFSNAGSRNCWWKQ